MAYKTIGQLDAATSVESADLIEIEQSGVSKYASINQVVPPLVRAEYASSNAVVPTSSAVIVQFDTQVEDTHSAVTTGASWKFTTPIQGIYSVSWTFLVATVAAGAVTPLRVLIYKNGVLVHTSRITATTDTGFEGSGYGSFRLAQGDEISVLTLLDTASTLGNFVNRTIAITRIGS